MANFPLFIFTESRLKLTFGSDGTHCHDNHQDEGAILTIIFKALRCVTRQNNMWKIISDTSTVTFFCQKIVINALVHYINNTKNNGTVLQ